MTEKLIENITINEHKDEKLPKDFYVKLRNSPDMEEKIDYIYATLKRQRRVWYFKLMLRLLLIAWVVYFMIYLPQETKGQISQKFQEILSQKVSQISQPIIDQTLQNIEKSQESQEVIDATLQNERVNQLLEKYKNAQAASGAVQE